MKSLVLFAFVLFFGLSTASAQLFWKQIRAHEEKILRDNEERRDRRRHDTIYYSEAKRLMEIARAKYPDLLFSFPPYKSILRWGEEEDYYPYFWIVNKSYRKAALQRFRDSLQREGYQMVAKKEGVYYHFRVEREKAFETIDDIVTLEETPHPNKLMARYYLEDLCERNIYAFKPFTSLVKEHSMEEGMLMNSKNALRFPSIDSVAREIKEAERQKALSGTLEDLITYYQYWGGNAHSWSYYRCRMCDEYVHVWNRELETLWQEDEEELEDEEVFARIKELLTSSQKLDDRSERIREQLYDAIYRKDTALLIDSHMDELSRAWLQKQKSSYHIRNLKILDFEGKYDPKHHVRSVDSIILEKYFYVVNFFSLDDFLKYYYNKFLERYPGVYPQWTSQMHESIRQRLFAKLKELYEENKNYKVVHGADLYYHIVNQKKKSEYFLSVFENSATSEEREVIAKRKVTFPKDAYNALLNTYDHIDFSITCGLKKRRPEGSLLTLAECFRDFDTIFPNFLTKDQKADREEKVIKLSKQGYLDKTLYEKELKEYEEEMRRRREEEERRRREDERRRKEKEEREWQQRQQMQRIQDCDGCNFLYVKHEEGNIAWVYLKNGNRVGIHTDGEGNYERSLSIWYTYTLNEMIKQIVDECRYKNNCE